MKRKTSNALLFYIIFLVLIPLVSSRFHTRIDWTSEKIFTLSPYTVQVLSSLKSEVKATWYRSGDLLKLTSSARTVGDFLDEYHAASGGNFSYSISDPGDKTDSKYLDSIGIISRQIETTENQDKVTKNIYSGILVEHNGFSRVIPFLVDQSTLEYDLTRFIVETENTTESASITKKNIALIYGNPSGASFYPYVGPWLSYAGFDVHAEKLPIRSLDSGSTLLVIGSANIDSETANAISRFLDDGGNAVFFVSGTSVNTTSDWKASEKGQDFIMPVLERNGIDIERNLVLDASNWQLSMPSLDKTKYQQIRYPFWIRVSPETLRPHPMILNGIEMLQLYWPSSLLLDTNADRTLLPLIVSSSASISMTAPFDTNPFGNQNSLIETSKQKARAILAVTSTAKGRVVCVSDEYCLSSMIDYTGSDANLQLLVNSAEWVSGKDKLLELKKTNALLEPVTADETAAIGEYFRIARIVMLISIPSLIFIFGVIVFISRRKKR